MRRGSPLLACALRLVDVAFAARRSDLGESLRAESRGEREMAGARRSRPCARPADLLLLLIELSARAVRAVDDSLRRLVICQVDPPSLDAEDPLPAALDALEVSDERGNGFSHRCSSRAIEGMTGPLPSTAIEAPAATQFY
jgi:hypothetical protein